MGPYGPHWSDLNIRFGTPKDSCTCKFLGETFVVPSGTDFNTIHASGERSTFADIDTVNRRVGQWGTFDLQRDAAKYEFTPAYTLASNFAVGVYMQGAGAGLFTTSAMGVGYAAKTSKTFRDPGQIGTWLKWWTMGWLAAECGMLSRRK